MDQQHYDQSYKYAHNRNGGEDVVPRPKYRKQQDSDGSAEPNPKCQLN
jgi:hypothetical protein